MRNILLSVLFISLSFNFYIKSAAANESDNSSFISATTYGQLPEKSMFVTSPSGKLVAYRDTNLERDVIVIVDLATSKMVDAVDVSEVKPNNIYFVDEDKLIMVGSKHGRIPKFRGRYNINMAFVYNLSSKNLFQLLVPGEGIFKGQTQLGTIVGISKDKKYAFMPAAIDAISLALMRVRLDEKARPRVVERGRSDVVDYFMNGDSEVIARERFDNKKNLHLVESYVDGKWVEVFREETEYATKSFEGLTPDKTKLFMNALSENGERRAYFTLSLVDGTISEPLFEKENKDVERPLTDIHRVVHGVQYSGFEPTYEFFDEKLNARINAINKALPEFTNYIRHYSNDWSTIVLYSTGPDNSGSYLRYDNGTLSMLSPARPDIPGSAVNPVIAYEYAARDGLTIPTLLTIPRAAKITQDNIATANLPAIMMPHGGPEAYDKIHFDYLAQYFANRGYLVIQPQFRGSSGFGWKHTSAGHGEWGRKMQDDLTDGVTTLTKEGVINGDRVCIVGGSYGGYAALAGAVFTPDLYKCVVSLNGVSDIENMMTTSKRNYGKDHWVIAYWEDVISEGDFDDDHLSAISPINHVDKINAPVLLVHGENDKVVPVKQSKEMYRVMKGADKDVTYVELEAGDHNLSTAVNRIKAMETIDAFISKHL